MTDYRKINSAFVGLCFGAGSKKAFAVIRELEDCGMSDRDLSLSSNIGLIPHSLRLKFSEEKYSEAIRIYKYCIQNNIGMVTAFDGIYPNSLRSIDAPPVILYYKGEFPDFNGRPSITVVGPRKASEFGLRAAQRLGYRFSLAGITVVSGGASGCDSAVHRGSLAEKGRTVMVLACGIDSGYLKENLSLRGRVADDGCIISEYPPHFQATRFSFPVRNRIMGALSDAAVIVEAPRKSGALITANAALSSGKTVYVIPGNPSQEEYSGSNRLLMTGAKPLIDIFDILNEYLSRYPDIIDTKKPFLPPKTAHTPEKTKKITKISKETLSKEANMLYNYIDKQIFTVDDFSSAPLSASDILSALTELELEGLITPLAGGKYKLN